MNSLGPITKKIEIIVDHYLKAERYTHIGLYRLYTTNSNSCRMAGNKNRTIDYLSVGHLKNLLLTTQNKSTKVENNMPVLNLEIKIECLLSLAQF